MAILVRGNSSKVLPFQPIGAHSYMAILVRGGGGGNSSKVLPLQPNSYIILLSLRTKYPTLLQQNGRILGTTFEPGSYKSRVGSTFHSPRVSGLSAPKFGHGVHQTNSVVWFRTMSCGIRSLAWYPQCEVLRCYCDLFQTLGGCLQSVSEKVSGKHFRKASVHSSELLCSIFFAVNFWIYSVLLPPLTTLPPLFLRPQLQIVCCYIARYYVRNSTDSGGREKKNLFKLWSWSIKNRKNM